MMRNHNSIILKLFWGVAFFLSVSLTMFAYLGSNGSGVGYSTDPETDLETEIRNNVIESYVELGAGYYFDAYADYLRFSKSFELQDQRGLNYEVWQNCINSSLSNIREAKQTYSQLINEAEITPYNWRVIYRLWFFDYYGFMKQKRLNSVIFGEVESYLCFGDITGIYKKIYNDMREIESILMKIKGTIDTYNKPELEDLWDLNDSFAHSVTFSQYVSRVFYSL